MKVEQSGIFNRRVKKLHHDEKLTLDEAVKTIMDNPSLGKVKTGDLAGIQVYKYKHSTQQYLLAYHFVAEEELMTLLALGTHENFYRDLKRP